MNCALKVTQMTNDMKTYLTISVNTVPKKSQRNWEIIGLCSLPKNTFSFSRFLHIFNLTGLVKLSFL